MNRINAEVLKSTCFSEVWEVRLAEKNYVGTCLTTGKTNHQFLLAWLTGAQREPIAIKRHRCSRAPVSWQVEPASLAWKACRLDPLLFSLLVEGEYDQCPPWYLCPWGQAPLWRQWLEPHTQEKAGLEHKSWDRSQVSPGPWAPSVNVRSSLLMEVTLLMGVHSTSLRPQPTLCLNHRWHWPIPRRTGENHSDSRMVTIPASGPSAPRGNKDTEF